MTYSQLYFPSNTHTHSLYSTQFSLPSPTPQTFLIHIPFRIHLHNCIYGGGGAKRRQKTSADTPLLTQYHGYLHPGYIGHGYRDLRYNSVHKYKTGVEYWYLIRLLSIRHSWKFNI